MVSLSEVLHEGHAVVVFYRGGWCPYCNIQLRAYQRLLPQLAQLGARLVAISPQLPGGSLSTAERNALGFAVLSDAGNGVARSFPMSTLTTGAVASQTSFSRRCARYNRQTQAKARLDGVSQPRQTCVRSGASPPCKLPNNRALSSPIARIPRPNGMTSAVTLSPKSPTRQMRR